MGSRNAIAVTVVIASIVGLAIWAGLSQTPEPRKSVIAPPAVASGHTETGDQAASTPNQAKQREPALDRTVHALASESKALLGRLSSADTDGVVARAQASIKRMDAALAGMPLPARPAAAPPPETPTTQRIAELQDRLTQLQQRHMQ